MALRSFNSDEYDASRQFLLDRRCERNHPKRHRTQKRAKGLAEKKRERIAHFNTLERARQRRYHEAVRAYWDGSGDHP